MRKRLEGKVVAVTGSTKGIGKGIAIMAAAEGAKVVISGRNAEDGRAAVEQIEREHGAEALFIQGDIGLVEDAERLIRGTVERFGRIDGLVNNAGIFPRSALVDTEEALFDEVFAVNVKGPFFCSKFAVRAMLESGGGSIVHMGSTHGYKGGKDLAAYAVSKGALLTLSRHIAANYTKHGIRSNWVTVGWVATEGELELHRKNGVDHDQLNAWAAKSVPSGRMQTAEDMAYGVIYLLADESKQVTNTELAITGGLNM